MAGKFNSAGLKKFFINHGEKLALGVVGLLVLFALATANWVPYGGDPVEIKRAAEQAKVDYDAKVFQPTDEESLGLVIKPEERPGALVDRQMLADWSAATYDLRVPMAVSLNDTKQPLKEIQDFFDKHPIRNLRADYGWVLLNLGPEVPAVPEGELPGTTTPEPPAIASATPQPPSAIPGGPNFADLDEQFQRRTNTAGGEGSIPGMTGEPGYMDTFTTPELMYYDDYATGMEGEGEMGMSFAGTKLKGRGQFFASVRGIVPLHELIRDVALARNIDFAEAASYFQLIDYHLERQVMNADGTWPAEDQWEVVDRATAESVLDEVDGFDLDPVPPQLTDVAITMPLPPRITGIWGKHATHPDIESFSLTQEEMENELKYQVALLTKVQEQQALQQTVQPELGPKVRGWADRAYDSRQLAAELYGSETSYTDTYEDYYSSQSEGALFGQLGGGPQQNDPKFQQLVKDLQGIVDKDKKNKALEDYIKNRVTAVGNLLLFRYVDFAVEPGKTYRYRARLELENPNFGERVADAAAPSVVEGETRMSAWSNVTAPISIMQDTYYFVNKIDPRRNVAELDFYHYDSALGTIVTNTEPDPPEDENLSNLQRLSIGFGEPIGGNMEVWELSPGQYSFAKDTVEGSADETDDDEDPKGYSFNTGDLLVLGLEDYDLSRADHPELTIPKEKNYDLQLVDAILVQKREGSLSQVDTVTQAPWKEYMALVVSKQNEPFRDLKQGPVPEGGELCPQLAELYGSEYMSGSGMMMEGEMGARRADSRTRSVMRKSSSRADAGTRAAAARRAQMMGP